MVIVEIITGYITAVTTSSPDLTDFRQNNNGDNYRDGNKSPDTIKSM